MKKKAFLFFVFVLLSLNSVTTASNITCSDVYYTPGCTVDDPRFARNIFLTVGTTVNYSVSAFVGVPNNSWGYAWAAVAHSSEYEYIAEVDSGDSGLPLTDSENKTGSFTVNCGNCSVFVAVHVCVEVSGTAAATASITW